LPHQRNHGCAEILENTFAATPALRRIGESTFVVWAVLEKLRTSACSIPAAIPGISPAFSNPPIPAISTANSVAAADRLGSIHLPESLVPHERRVIPSRPRRAPNSGGRTLHDRLPRRPQSTNVPRNVEVMHRFPKNRGTSSCWLEAVTPGKRKGPLPRSVRGCNAHLHDALPKPQAILKTSDLVPQTSTPFPRARGTTTPTQFNRYQNRFRGMGSVVNRHQP